MPYIYEYTEGLKQFGMIHLILKLTDSDNILPEINTPIVLDENEYSEEKIKFIANQIISNYNVVEEPVVEETPVVEEPVVEEPVVEEPVVEEPVVEETPVVEEPVVEETPVL